MNAFRKCSSIAQDRAGAVCEQPSACRSYIRSAAPLCLSSPAPLGDSALKLRGLSHGASDCAGSRQLQCYATVVRGHGNSGMTSVIGRIVVQAATVPGAM